MKTLITDQLQCKCKTCGGRFQTLRNYKEQKVTCPNCGDNKYEILENIKEHSTK